MTTRDGRPVAEVFWEGCGAGELLYERCRSCGTVNTYPRGFCTACGCRDTVWERSGRRGVVYSAARVLRSSSVEFQAIAPYGLFLANLDEGFRIMAHGDPDLEVGSGVRVDFREVAGRALPYLRRPNRREDRNVRGS